MDQTKVSVQFPFRLEFYDLNGLETPADDGSMIITKLTTSCGKYHWNLLNMN